jgi:hypothetical protein
MGRFRSNAHMNFFLNLMEKKKMKKLLGLMLFGVLTVAVYTPSADASYNFSVKVINKTGGTITNVSTGWIAKPSKLGLCWYNVTIKNNKYNKESCMSSASVQKWKRRLKVSFDCASGNSSVLYFPRGSNKWYAKDHAVKNGDKYTVKIKQSDC